MRRAASGQVASGQAAVAGISIGVPGLASPLTLISDQAGYGGSIKHALAREKPPQVPANIERGS